MRYPLNVTPLNGYDTLYGSGVAQQDLAAAGGGHLIMHAGGQGTMSASAEAKGLVAVAGNALAYLNAEAIGIAYLIIHGVGLALDQLTAFGDGVVLPKMGGVARMGLSVLADGRVAVAAASAALLRLIGSDGSRNSISARGTGLADLIMGGRAGTPSPKIPPAFFSATHASRVVMVDADVRSITSSASDSRVIFVPAEDRTIHVSPEREV